MRNNYRKFGAVLALAGLVAATAFGQMGQRGDTFAKYGGREGAQLEGPDNLPLDLKPGDRVRFKNSSVVMEVGEDGIVLPIDVSVAVLRKGTDREVEAHTKAPRSQHAFGFYPVSIFSVAGQLRRNDNSFGGGTRSVAGSVFSYDATSNLDRGQRFEAGVFFFQPYSVNDGDLYQISARYFINRQLGFQFAYLNTTKGSGHQDASSFSYHVLLDVVSVPVGRPDARQVSARLGLGVLNNLSQNYEVADNRFVGRNTFNFSTFVDLSYNLTSRVSINATEWFIRDRNADLNRFSVGASYKF